MRSWQRALVEAGGPNTLLWFEDSPGGTLDLTTAHPGGVSMLMAGRATRLSDLVREPSAFAEARRRAEGIRAKTDELSRERGLTTGFMAIGMASWTVNGVRRSPQAPVLLRGCSLHPTDPTHRDYDVDLSPVVELNPVLVHYLASEQGIDVDADALAALAHSARRFDPLPVFRELTRLCRSVPNFRVADRKVVAPFSYAKLPLVADLVSHGEGYADSRLVRLLAEAEASPGPAAPRPSSPDDSAQAEKPELLVLPADAEQRRIVAAVRAGQDVAVDSAAGTGRTQTLTNVIAGLVADGKRILVVSQSAAPLAQLHARLDDVGLGQAAIRVGEGGLDRGQLARAVRDVLELDVAPGREPDVTDVQEGLRRRREILEAHRDAQHEAREPWGVTVFEGLSALARLTRPRRPPTSRVRLTGDTLANLDRHVTAHASQLLTQAAAAGAWSEDRAKDPWAHARVTTDAERERALALVQELSARRLAADGAAIDAVLTASGLPAAKVPSDWAARLRLLEGVRTTLETFTAEVFGGRLGDYLGATGDKEYRREHGIRQAWWTRWSLRRQLRELVRPGAEADDLHDVLEAAFVQREQWSELSGGASTPRVPDGLDNARHVWAQLDADLHWLSERLTTTAEGGDVHGVPLGELRARLARLGGRADRIAVLPVVVPLLDELTELGLGPLAEDLAARRVPTESVAAELDFVWWRSVLDFVAATDPQIGEHDASALREAAAEYADFDVAWMRTNAEIAAARQAHTAREVARSHPDQVHLVQSEAARWPDHLSVDRLVAEAGDVVLAAVPCWLTSPLLVASVLPPGEHFDVVVIEEAGRLEPAQAVAALSRARQVILVGDSRGLAPSPFTTSVGGALDVAGRGERRSILDLLGPRLRQLPLSGHYRSRDERVVAFANRHFYGGRLRTLPGASTAGGADPVRLVRIEEPEAGVSQAGPEDQVTLLPDTVELEVARVVDLALDHARGRPNESLAIATLTPEHAERVTERLRSRLDSERDPAVVDFFAELEDEACLILPLDRLHAQTRDAVVLTLGLEPGQVRDQRLGALSRNVGDRALASVLTMARRRFTLVCSVERDDLDGRLRSRAVTLLGELIAYCERGGRDVAVAEGAERTPDESKKGTSKAAGVRTLAQVAAAVEDPVLAEFAVRLRREGLVVHEQYGTGLSPIDLVVEDPHLPGRSIVAIESDGARDARLTDTRERERLRPECLTELGWEYVRVFSMDIFADPARDIARILDAVRAADARSSWSGRGQRTAHQWAHGGAWSGARLGQHGGFGG